MSETFLITRGDRSPALKWEIAIPDLNLLGASVVFNMRRTRDNEPIILRAEAGVVEGTVLPTLIYEWTVEDTAEAGLFIAEFEVIYADGKPETFPSEKIVVKIDPDLG